MGRSRSNRFADEDHNVGGINKSCLSVFGGITIVCEEPTVKQRGTRKEWHNRLQGHQCSKSEREGNATSVAPPYILRWGSTATEINFGGNVATAKETVGYTVVTELLRPFI